MIKSASHGRSLRVAAASLVLLAGGPLLAADYPEVRQPNFRAANQFSQEIVRQYVYSLTVQPTWLGKTDRFWYSYRVNSGTNWWLVDADKAKKEPLFDRSKLTTLLIESLKKPLDPAMLPLTALSVDEAATKMKFTVEGFQFEYDLKSTALTKLGKAPTPPAGPPAGGPMGGGRGFRGGGAGGPGGAAPGDYKNTSPDKKFYIFARKHNLWLAEEGKEDQATQISTDGVKDFSFGGDDTDRKARVFGTWSPDSRRFQISRNDQRGMGELWVLNSLSNPRPSLETYKYSMPGEEKVARQELYTLDRDTKKLTRVPAKWKDEAYQQPVWGKTADELRFVRRDRLFRNLELCSLNPGTGESRVVLNDGFENTGLNIQPIRYLDELDAMLWWSERSGWGHYYLYGRDGKLINQVTSGDFRASTILEVDPKSKTLWFTANGREPNENLNNDHQYSIKLDGSDLTLLTPGNASHQASLSPTRKFLVDNAARVDLAPSSTLRNAKGEKVLDLESADLFRLVATGWRMPETFVVKAEDGVTDLYGNMWKPFDFNPRMKYPIILNVYPGPQTEGVNDNFAPFSSAQQLAQIGFVVIQVGNRGGSPARNKAYQSYGYFNLRDYGLADKKAAVEQLAARFPFIDIERVGIYGHSGGGFMTAAAMLLPPYNQFFKAGVASAGNHDNNIYNNFWSERYHGLKEVPKAEGSTETKFEIRVPTNVELAANLKGHLMLAHGDMDNNVHPANTIRLADALIKANKRFDLVILPGQRHGFGPYQAYFQHRMWDFFVEHLMGVHQTSADILEKQDR